MSHSALCGLSRVHRGELVTELAPRWEARCESGRRQRRRGDRRQAGAGPKYALVFTGRLLVTLARLRTGLTREALDVTCQAGSSTTGRGDRRDQAAAGRARVRRPATTRPASAHPGRRVRLRRGRKRHTAHRRRRNPGPPAEGRTPRTGRLVSGKRKQNTIKTATISDGQGRILWCGAVRPGRMHDQTATRAEGIAGQFRLCPRVKAEAGEGYRGLASEFPGQVSAQPRKPENPGEGAITGQYGWRQAGRRQSCRRIAVGHASAGLRQWRPLQRWTGRRQDYAGTHCASAGLVCDRAARRAARHRTRARLPHRWPGRLALYTRQDGSIWTHQSDVS
jgi:hypothetical protein